MPDLRWGDFVPPQVEPTPTGRTVAVAHPKDEKKVGGEWEEMRVPDADNTGVNNISFLVETSTFDIYPALRRV